MAPVALDDASQAAQEIARLRWPRQRNKAASSRDVGDNIPDANTTHAPASSSTSATEQAWRSDESWLVGAPIVVGEHNEVQDNQLDPDESKWRQALRKDGEEGTSLPSAKSVKVARASRPLLFRLDFNQEKHLAKHLLTRQSADQEKHFLKHGCEEQSSNTATFGGQRFS